MSVARSRDSDREPSGPEMPSNACRAVEPTCTRARNICDWRLREQRRDNWNKGDWEDPFRLRSCSSSFNPVQRDFDAASERTWQTSCPPDAGFIGRVFKMGDEALATVYR